MTRSEAVRTGARKVTTWESPVVVAPWHSPTSMRRSSDGRPLALNESSSDLEVRRLFSPLAPWSGGRAESTGSARPGRSALAPALATFRSSRCGRHCVSARYRVRPVGSAPVSIGVACTSPPTLDPPASLSGRAARSIGAHTTSDLVAADASARPRGRASDDERPVRPMLGHIRPVA
jgi:hypothetical protein